MKFLSKEMLYSFAVGIGAGVVVSKAANSKCAHDLAVKTVAKALLIKDEASKKALAMKEEAEDIYAEAKAKKQQESVAEFALSEADKQG